MLYNTSTFQQITVLSEQSELHKNCYKPVIYNLKNLEHQKNFDDLIANTKNIQVFDHIYTQLEELIKCIQPSIVLSAAPALQDAIAKKLNETPLELYGVWVYYPWLNKLVHILDEEEFTIVRTNRNKHKITAEEQAKLATKKIGVMGLSVGQSVSLTLAMERGFGELRIADFDELDLSNINRIRTGIYNLKLKKTVIVAREIAEIDPFLKVVCFEEGITEQNLDDFLIGNGKLDLLIDECDSFDIKINARHKAKKLGIPVLMEGSDRGTIDIERFDIEPDRPVLHGMVSHLDLSSYSSLKTMDERLPFITAVTGIETLSPRMKGSAIEIMSTISTWPQLASAVTFGGGITADLSRKILLNTLQVSGRFFIDLDELIKDTTTADEVKEEKNIELLTTSQIKEYLENNNLSNEGNCYQPTEDVITTLILAASKAPSGGNNQPWRWHYQKGILHLFLEQKAAQAYLDPQQLSSYLSIGATIENLILAAEQLNLAVNWKLTPDLSPNHLAWFTFEPQINPNIEKLTLAKQINFRHTNRKITSKVDLAEEIKTELNNLVIQTEFANLKWITDESKIKILAQISSHADLLRMFIDEAHTDFIQKEMRWSVDQAMQTQDGIGIHTLDLSNNDYVGLQLVKDKKAINFLKEINGGSAFKRLTMQQFLASSAIGIITMPNYSVQNLINGGMALERLWLGASHLDFKIHPINVPLIFFYKNTVEKNLNIPVEDKAILTSLEGDFKALADLSNNEQAIFMFRIFKASPSPEKTIRKSLNKIFSIGRD